MSSQAKRVLADDGAMLKAAKALGKIIAIAIILIVAAFGDVMYIVAMQGKFPDGPLLVMCYLGAFTSFLAVGYLLLGKSVAFRPGGQLLGAWIVFVAELLIIALNILLVFDSSSTGLMAAWAFISPASPVLHMLGVALLYYMDPDLHEKHKDMELQAKLNDAEREYVHSLENAKLDLKRKQLEYTVSELQEAVNSPESRAFIRAEAIRMNALLLSELSGRSVNTNAPALQVPRQRDTDPDLSVYDADDGASASGVRLKKK